MEIRETDVCVVGGGPAGLSLALLLLRSGVRVTVLERSGSLDREYRGEILQPGGQRVLDDLGVLAGARARGCHPHRRFRLVDRDRVLIDSDYETLPGDHRCLLSIPQRHVLEELLAACRAYDDFTYVGGCKVNRLLSSRGAVTGAEGQGPSGKVQVLARCVVGADGRYSKVRRLAGIEAGRSDVFDHDIVWFRLPVPSVTPGEVRIERSGGNPVLTYTSHPDTVQIGWTIPHGRYADFAGNGIEYVRERLVTAAPDYADAIREHVRSFKDLSLLDVFAADAAAWAADGLVLVGDSAHTHSPIGAQGINLALQDAVVLHRVLVDALNADDTSEAALAAFHTARRGDIARITRTQMLQSKMMLATGGVAAAVRPRMAALLSRSPVYRKIFALIAFGNPSIRVEPAPTRGDGTPVS
ncbi:MULTISPECIES: FAD-dependent monooxygenase [unclassified Nocardiopsis]|uniref:FAD-dependent monooxygenase n=1 Tax=Nocardiopsis TaxID=2013 RepID=UPI00387B5A4E